MTRRSIFLFFMIEALLVIAGAALLLVFSPSYDLSRGLLDSLSTDGSLELYRPEVYGSFRGAGIFLGILALAAAAAVFLQRRLVGRGLEHAFSLPAQLRLRLGLEWRELCQAARALGLLRYEYWLIGGLVLLALFARVAIIMHPMEHDEAYTVSVFAYGPLKEGLSDYHHPNNHLFHTLLVHFAIKIFGLAPWAVRLPALTVGVLLVPAVYFFARALYGRAAAQLAALFCAVMPGLMYMSTNARGYTLIMLLTVLILLMGRYVIRRKSLLGWGFLVLFAVLGFYTIPIFALSYTAMLSWLVLDVLLFEEQVGAYRSKWEFFVWLAGSGAAVGLLSFMLYSPLFIRYGTLSVLSPAVPKPAGLGIYLGELISRLKDNYVEWMRYLPGGAAVFAAAGALFALVRPAAASPGSRKMARLLPYAGLLSTAGMVIGLEANIYPRFMSFIIPLLLIWIAAGWAGLLALAARSLRLPAKIVDWTSVLALLIVGLVSVVQMVRLPDAGFNRPGEIEKLSLYLRDHLQEQDLVVISPPHDAKLWYYSRLYGIDMDHYKRELPFFRAYVVVDPVFVQTVESVLVERGPELFFFDLSAARPVFQSGPVTAYELIPNPDLIRSEYDRP